MITTDRWRVASDWASKLRVESVACSTNEILPDQDQDILRALLAESQKEIDTLDMEISRIQDLLNTHRARHTAAVERMTRLQTGMAPHKKLPPELLARIFVESLGQDSVHFPLFDLPFPWVLAQVCSKWRTISRTEPLLWSRLDISSLHTYRRKRSVIPLIQDILSNHGGMGRVEIRVGSLTNGEWNGMLSLLQRYSSRVWRLCVSLGNPSSPIRALCVPLEVFDELESLSLSLDNSDSLNLGRQTIYAFSNARRLFEVNIKTALQLPRTVNLDVGMLPWTQLTHLTLSNMAAGPVLTILSHCPSLSKLIVTLPASKGHAPTSVSNLKRLEFLSITGSTCSHFSELLAGLITPSLKQIVLINHVFPKKPLCLDDPLVTNLISFIGRSGPNLYSIQTDSLSIQPEDMLTLMRLTPMLTTWDFLTQSPVPESVMSTILDEGLVPNLHTLRGWQIPSIHSALRFLNNRWSETSPGNYEGIRDSTFHIKMSNYQLSDRKYFRDILPQLQTHGRRIQLQTSY